MTREQLIEKIVKWLENFEDDTGVIEIWTSNLRMFLEEIIPQPTGVDALVEKYKELHEAEQMVEAGEVLQNIQSLQQPTQTNFSLEPWQYMKNEHWNITTYEDEQKERRVCSVCWLPFFACDCKF